MLIDAFAKVAADDPELHLVMAGPDQQQWSAELQQTAAKAGIAARIHWPGMITGDAKWGAFYGAEAFILPSHQENFGIAVAEAMACGTPVLLSDKVNIAEEIANDGAGFMEPDTPDGTLQSAATLDRNFAAGTRADGRAGPAQLPSALRYAADREDNHPAIRSSKPRLIEIS